VRQTADEAAFLQRRDQPVDAGFGAQIERILHLIERRRNAILLHALMDEHEQIALLFGQHIVPRSFLPVPFY
jgi:hypothetical protein